jgi:hypothetical protein
MKPVPLFPPKRNHYEGHTIIVIIAVLLAIVSTARSLVHILFPDGGASVIAGMDLSGALASAVIFTFAWAGLYQLNFAIIQWIVIIRYREFLPLVLLLIFFEQVMLFVIPLFKPIAETVLTRTPLEATANKLLLPVMLVLFLASLIKKRS